MNDRILWCAPLLLGAMFVLSAVTAPRARAKWYVRLLIGIAGIWLLYVSTSHVFLLKSK